MLNCYGCESQVAIPSAQIYTIDASLSPEAAAVDYTSKLAQIWGNEVRTLCLAIDVKEGMAYRKSDCDDCVMLRMCNYS